MKFELTKEQLNYLTNQAVADQKGSKSSDNYSDIIDMAAVIASRELGGTGRRKQTLAEFWDDTTPSGRRNRQIMYSLADKRETFCTISKKLGVAHGLVVRVKDTVAMMHQARTAGQSMPEYPAPSKGGRRKSRKS